MTPEHKAAIAEGKRKAKERRAVERLIDSAIPPPREAIEPFRHAKSVQVTYRPFDGDPHSTVWNGVKFKANVPVALHRDMKDHYIEQLLPKTFPGTNGESLTKHVPSQVFMGDLAKDNPSFDVDGQQAHRKINSRIVPPPGAEWTDAHEGSISYSSQLDDVA